MVEPVYNSNSFSLPEFTSSCIELDIFEEKRTGFWYLIGMF